MRIHDKPRMLGEFVVEGAAAGVGGLGGHARARRCQKKRYQVACMIWGGVVIALFMIALYADYIRARG
jgi:hypothetical protein